MVRYAKASGREKSQRLGWVGLSLAIAFGLFYVGLACGSGLDRLTETHPELVNAVPSLFASEALRVAGAQALADNNAYTMIDLGKRALRDAPTDPQSAAMLGAGFLAKKDETQANRAFRVAGQLGWRVPITQSYWFSKALSASDYKLAALRLDALLRQQPNLLSQRQLLDPIERNPAGRSAFVQRMALKPEWLPNYVMDVALSPLDVVMQRSDVLEDAGRQGLILGCPTIAPIIARLLELKLPNQAHRLASEHCRESERLPPGSVGNP